MRMRRRPAVEDRLPFTVCPGRSWFQTRCLWVQNTGDHGWTLGDYFHYLPSHIGGSEADQSGSTLPALPDYWLKIGCWGNPALRLAYGVVPPQADKRIECRFWRSPTVGSEHPDCWRIVHRTLKPGERWDAAADEPAATVFGLRETPADPQPWLRLIAKSKSQI